MPDRKVAKKVLVKDIVKGTYIKRPGWDPSGVLTEYGEITRANIIGVVVATDGASFLLDDGTGNINVRIFDRGQDLSRFVIGDMVNVVGKPREWESEKYIVPEIVRKIDKTWFDVRQLEIRLQKKTDSIKLPVQAPDEEEFETGPYQQILNAIAILDKGSGADIEDIIGNLKLPGCEKIIRNLIEEGEVFEVSPGRIKVLE